MTTMSATAARTEIGWLIQAVVLALEEDDEESAQRIWRRMSHLIDHLRSLDAEGDVHAEIARNAADATAREATRLRLQRLIRELGRAEGSGDDDAATRMHVRIDLEEERLLDEAHLHR